MRTIKFRGKYTETGEWRYGYYARLSNEFKEWHCIMTEKDASENYIKDCNGFHMQYTPVVPSTVGQFTCLRDKNGKEIYEGDILKVQGTRERIEVRFVRGVFAFLWNGNLDDEAPINAPTQEWAEVIGNIHDNPNLLKGGQK